MEMLYVAVLVSVLALCHCQKDIMIENTTYVNIMASGIKMMASNQTNITEDNYALTVELNGLKQTNGTNYFKEAIFPSATTITDPTDITASDKVPASKQVTSTLAITDQFGATLTLKYDVFTENGNLKRGDETISVMKGDVKVSAEISGYTFPDDAPMLELSLNISGSETAKMKDGEMTTYTLGGGRMVKLSGKVMDGTEDKDVMPKMEGNMFMVTFSNTSSKLEYSVVLMLADVSTGDVTTTPKPSSCTRVTSLGVIVWFLLIVHRILC